jgi:hypothetical protein
VACISGWVDVVPLLLKDIAIKEILDSTDSEGHTALYYLASDDHYLNLVQLLLSLSADVNAQDPNTGWTALSHASAFGSEEIVRLLLRGGAEINCADKDKWTALHQAIYSRQASVVKILLENEIDTSIRTEDTGETALHQAARNGYEEVVQLLLDYNADITATTTKDETPLQLAARAQGEGHKIVIKALSKKMNGSLKDALVQIASLEEEDTVDYLLATLDGTSLVKSNVAEEVKLIWNAARKHCHWVVCEKLQKLARELPDEDTTDWKALQWAAYLGYHVIVWWLLVSAPSKEMDEIRKLALKVAEKQRKLVEKRKPVKEGEESGNAIQGDGSVATVKVEQEKKTEKTSTSESPPTNAGGGTVTKQEHEQMREYSLTVDMLRDPPLVQGWSEPDESYEKRTISGELKQLAKEFDATIIDFYSEKEKEGVDQRVDFLRRTREVWEVIYMEEAKESGPEKSSDEFKGGKPRPKTMAKAKMGGPQNIMEEARTKLKEISSDSKATKQKEYSEKDLQFRWIHLPANNVSQRSYLHV